MSDMQLEMNFEHSKNCFQKQLELGNFVLLIENSSPGRDNDPKASADRLAALEETVLGIKDIHTSLAITDRYSQFASWRAAEYASALSAENRDRHVIYISGRDTTADEVNDLIQLAGNAGLRNVVAVSGSKVPGEGLKETRRRTFTESISTLQMLQKGDFYCGATVNPYQYTPFSLMGQYYKMGKKFRNGASFGVVQAGWDMLKLQSLLWYLRKQDLYIPMIARLIWLTPDKVERILAGEYPGITISRDFRKILEKELRYSNNQFEAAQLRRLELQAAGLRLLGFSGIQLAGAELPNRAKVVAERIAGALQEFTGFEHWLSEYNSYLARTEMAPFWRSFYLYDRVLSRPYPEDAPPAANDMGPVEVSRMEKIRYAVRKFLFHKADQQVPESAYLLKKSIALCRGNCEACLLPQCEYVCPRNCPKGLIEGPCGGVTPQGNCEVNPAQECRHCKIVRHAHWRGTLPELEYRTLTAGKKSR